MKLHRIAISHCNPKLFLSMAWEHRTGSKSSTPDVIKRCTDGFRGTACQWHCVLLRNIIKIPKHHRAPPAMWCLAMRYKLTRQTVVVWINHAQTIVWFVGLGCKSKMWLTPTLSIIPNYIPSNIKEDNLRVQTFRVLYASGTAAPHTSHVGICVSWRPTQRPCDVKWMMCYHLSIYPSR